jgi:hypothetical protein
VCLSPSQLQVRTVWCVMCVDTGSVSCHISHVTRRMMSVHHMLSRLHKPCPPPPPPTADVLAEDGMCDHVTTGMCDVSGHKCDEGDLSLNPSRASKC